jgi:hypothetical protein
VQASLRPIAGGVGIAGAVIAIVAAAWMFARTPAPPPARSPFSASAAPQLRLDARLDLSRLAKRGS